MHSFCDDRARHLRFGPGGKPTKTPIALSWLRGTELFDTFQGCQPSYTELQCYNMEDEGNTAKLLTTLCSSVGACASVHACKPC